MMSVEEDTELRDLVSQTLESKGVLSKIRVRLLSLLFIQWLFFSLRRKMTILRFTAY